MSAWPSQTDLIFAALVGHVPDRKAGRCSCDDWAVKHIGIPREIQLANHIWTVVHKAKEDRALRMGGKICMPCKGTGISTLFESTCAVCRGAGIEANDEERSRLKQVAIHLGHEPQRGRLACTCGSTMSWEDHAVEVGFEAIRELEEFEEQLRHG